jgi:hypothetical protein
MTPAKCLKTYHKLPEPQKAILHLQALFYFKTRLEYLRESFFSLKHLFPNAALFDNQSFHNCVDKLKSQQFMRYDNALHEELAHFLTLEAFNSEHAKLYLQAINQITARSKDLLYNLAYAKGIELWQQSLRLAIYTKDQALYQQAAHKLTEKEIQELLVRLFGAEPLAIEWLTGRFPIIQYGILQIKLAKFYEHGSIAKQIPGLLEHYLPLRQQYLQFGPIFINYDIVACNLSEAKTALSTFKEVTPAVLCGLGTVEFLSGHTQQAIAYFESALKLERKLTNRRKVFLGAQATLLYCLALLKTGDRQLHSKIQTLITHATEFENVNAGAFEAISQLLTMLQGRRVEIKPQNLPEPRLAIARAIKYLVLYWLDAKQLPQEKLLEYFKDYSPYAVSCDI